MSDLLTASGAAYDVALYDAALAAFDEAGWRRSEANERGVFGTTVMVDGRPFGGSLQVLGTVVRYLAFGTTTAGRDGAFADLFAIVNPTLPTGSFELHPMLGPVCRTSVDLEAALDGDGGLRDGALVRDVVLGLATAATGLFEGFVNVLETVAGGADAVGALAAAGWTGDGAA